MSQIENHLKLLTYFNNLKNRRKLNQYFELNRYRLYLMKLPRIKFQVFISFVSKLNHSLFEMGALRSPTSPRSFQRFQRLLKRRTRLQS